MLRVKNSIIYALGLMTLDALLVVITFYSAFYLRNLYYLSTVGQAPIDINLYNWLLPILIAVHLFTLWFTGLYLSSRRQLFLQTSFQVLQGVLLGGFISASVIFYTKSQLLSRLYFVIFSLILLVLMLAVHNLIVFFLGLIHKRGFHQRKVLVVANKNNVAQALAIFKRQPQWGFNVVKIVDPQDASEKIFDAISVDEVFLNITPQEMDKVQNIIVLCEIRGIPFHFYSNILPVKYSKPQLDFFMDEPVLSYYRKYLSMDQKLIKRGLDILGGLLGSVLTLLLTPFVFILIKIEDGGPVFFKQNRIGLKQNIFQVYKFRTMRVDAEKLEEGLKSQNEMKDTLFKMKEDPRVTRIGKWLRKTSLDEFPQFFNVLIGQMSLVGPRPIAEKYINKYEEHHYHRLNMKPGLTGLWQVRGRNKIVSYERMVELDNRYIDYWSIWMDIKIIWQTLKILLLKKTGY